MLCDMQAICAAILMIIMDLSVDLLCHCESLESRQTSLGHKSELPLYAEHAELSPPVACFGLPTLDS